MQLALIPEHLESLALEVATTRAGYADHENRERLQKVINLLNRSAASARNQIGEVIGWEYFNDL
jgi:hypothetical protein